jgi:hypothetical protein
MKINYRIYEDFGGGWLWVIFGTDGDPAAESGQCYTRRSDADRALKRFIKRISKPHTLKQVEW